MQTNGPSYDNTEKGISLLLANAPTGCNEERKLAMRG